LPGTGTGDTSPLWSPDGAHIAFTRGPSSGLIGAPGPYNLIITDAAGANSRPLTSGKDAHFARAWMPDGTHLLFTTAQQIGESLQLMDVQTGSITPLFDINYNGNVAVSPDGKRVAFEEMLPLDKYGLFVSDLDGSNRTQLADGDPFIVTVPNWSPDGNWILASVHDPDPDKLPNPMLALIQVDGCQVIPLPNLGGYVSAWLP
jgi:Tol biopolymer transport system component